MKLLLTAFEPFDDDRNSSLDVLKMLRRKRIPRVALSTAVLPVDAALGPRGLLQALRRRRPDAVLCLGQAQRSAVLRVERLAINLLDFRRPDNVGARVVDRPVVRGGPAAYFATVPARALCEAMRKAGVPAELSQDAGTYLCNQVFYAALHAAATAGGDVKVGFIHLPMLPEQVARRREPNASLSVETMVRGLMAAIEVLSRPARPGRGSARAS